MNSSHLLRPEPDNGAHAHVAVVPNAPQRSGLIRVAALIDTAQVSGPGRQLAALARCLAGLGVELLVITFQRTGRPRSPYPDYLARAGVRHVVLPERGRLDVRLIPRLRRALANWSPTIVQTHGYKPTALAYMLRRTGARWPWIAFFHGLTSEDVKTRFYHWLDRRMMTSADRVVAMSRDQQARFSHLGAKACVVYNAAIPLAPEESQLPAVLPQGGDGPLLGVVGRLSREKGVDIFLHACRELARREVVFSAIVAGDGPERQKLERLRDSLGLRDRAQFLGAIPAVQALYSRLDVLVIPSRSEGLPNVLLEALREDVPVVATRVGAIPDVLESSLAGILAPSGDATALADAIERALPLKTHAASSSARHLLCQRFSLERRAQEHLRLYDEVLEQASEHV